jgi:hypothetical protein
MGLNFKLTLHDREGVELHDGDIVAISDGKRFNFYSEVKYNPEKKCIYPFHTFSFHSVKKVDILPAEAKECNELDYKCWYVNHEDAQWDLKADEFAHYLLSWRECERLLEKNMFHIEPLLQTTLF